MYNGKERIVNITEKSFPVKPKVKRLSLLLDFRTVQDFIKAILDSRKALNIFFLL